MNFFPADPGSGLAVQSYGPGHVVINGELLQRNLVLTPERIIRDWRPSDFADLAGSDFAGLAELEPEVLLLGTGRRQRFPAPETYLELIRLGIGLEIMDTGAACRTYNILMSEQRRVVAALLMIEKD
jgi:uncharacterized protein